MIGPRPSARDTFLHRPPAARTDRAHRAGPKAIARPSPTGIEHVFSTVGLIGKHDDSRAADTLARLIAYLRARSIEVVVDTQSPPPPAALDITTAERDELGRRCDLVIVVAGDGTFLSAARSLVHHGVPLLGINLGQLGFLADIMPDDMTDQLDEILGGRFEEETRFLLRTRIVRDGKTIIEVDALNDVVAHKLHIARLISFETHIDSRLVNTQRSDGLIIATPTGSTAYALSGGGPILHPNLDAVVLVPICPHTLSARPLVVQGDANIEIRMDLNDRSQAQLTCDGQTALELVPGDHIVVNKRDRAIRLIHPAGHDHYATLRAKLHWAREI